MNEIERRYELKSIELEVRLRDSERKMALIAVNEKSIIQKNNITKTRFKDLKKNLRALPPGEKPKASCERAKVIESGIEGLKTSIIQNGKELEVLQKNLLSERKLFVQTKRVLEHLEDRAKIQKQEKCETLEIREQDSLLDDVAPYSGTFQHGGINIPEHANSSDISTFNDPGQKQGTHHGSSQDEGDASENSSPKQEAKPSEFKEHSLTVDVKSKDGDRFTIDVQDRGGLLVNITTPTEREKTSLLKEKAKLAKELASLGIPLSALFIRKRG